MGTLKSIQLQTTSHRVTSQGLAELKKLRPEVKIEGAGVEAAK